MFIELTKEEYTDIFACLDRSKVRAYDTIDNTVETRIIETDVPILVRYHPYSDPLYDNKNEESTLYQVNPIPDTIVRPADLVQKIVLHDWKDLQLVMDLLKGDENARITDGKAD